MWMSCKVICLCSKWMEGWKRRRKREIRQLWGGKSGSFKCEFWKLVRLPKKRETFGGRKA